MSDELMPAEEARKKTDEINGRVDSQLMVSIKSMIETSVDEGKDKITVHIPKTHCQQVTVWLEGLGYKVLCDQKSEWLQVTW